MKNKKNLALSIFGLFVVVFALQFVAAADPLSDPIKEMFQGWFMGEGIGTTFAKIIFLIIVTIIIQSVGSTIPGMGTAFDKTFWGVLLSGAIAFLAVAYITPEEIFSMMIGYSAMGYVLAGGLPFLILLGYTYKIATEKGNAGAVLGRKLFAYVMWGGFTLFSVYRLLIVYVSGEPFSYLIAIIFPLGGLLMLVFTGAIFNKIRTEMNKEIDTKAKRTTIAGTNNTIAEAKAWEAKSFDTSE